MGKYSGLNIYKLFSSFFSPVKFWMVYGYWVSLISIVILRDHGTLNSALGLPDWIISLRPEFFHTIPFECFISISVFFINAVFVLFWQIGKGATKVTALLGLHIILIMFLSPKVFEFLSLGFAYTW